MNLLIRKASASWQSGPKGGARTLNTESALLRQVRVGFEATSKRELGADPGELFAAAHASSFSLALSHELGLRQSVPGQIETTATVTLEHLTAGWTIRSIHLNVAAKLPVTQGEFIDAAVRAKTSCAVSSLLRLQISMNAKLESEAPGTSKGAG